MLGNDPGRLAPVFKALGDPTRLRILTYLMGRCCPMAVDAEGRIGCACCPTVGELAGAVGGSPRITSTFSHHLHELREAGLIAMEKRGRFVVCQVRREAVGALVAILSAPVPERCACSMEGEGGPVAQTISRKTTVD